MPESPREFPELLKKKYTLQASPEAESAAKRTKGRTGETVPNEPTARIENYLDRFQEILDREDPAERQEGIEAIKRLLLRKFVTKLEDIPESYWKLQERMMRERGQAGDYARFSDEEKTKWKRELSEGLLADQRASLEQWIDYLASEDSAYLPKTLKYWVFRNVTDLQEYDKEKHEFPKRSRGTVKLFPDINHEALAYVIDALSNHLEGKDFDFGQHAFDVSENEKAKFNQFLKQENFGKLYAWAHELIKPIPEHLLKVTEGQWMQYDQDQEGTENYKSLQRSIQGRGTGWCTAGENTARTQLLGGDFHVFYSNDDDGNPTNPRIAIRMEQGKIAEVRGIAARQNLDPFMADVLGKKLDEFPDKAQYLKKDADMKRLTEIERKTTAGRELTKQDLVFLYELESPIDGFGYEEDPRIKELRTSRNPEEDMPIVFECAKEQIARSVDQIDEYTMAYVGPLAPGIFDKLPDHVEHIYTTFPEGKIHRYETEIGGKTKNELKKELKSRNIWISDFADDLLESKDFTTAKKSEEIHLIRLAVEDLGFESGATTDEIYFRAKELGLELCPAEVGPHFRLSYDGSDLIYIAMKQIADRGGGPSMFYLNRDADGLRLRAHRAEPSRRWLPDYEFLFRLRKLET